MPMAHTYLQIAWVLDRDLRNETEYVDTRPPASTMTLMHAPLETHASQLLDIIRHVMNSG